MKNRTEIAKTYVKLVPDLSELKSLLLDIIKVIDEHEQQDSQDAS